MCVWRFPVRICPFPGAVTLPAGQNRQDYQNPDAADHDAKQSLEPRCIPGWVPASPLTLIKTDFLKFHFIFQASVWSQHEPEHNRDRDESLGQAGVIQPPTQSNSPPERARQERKGRATCQPAKGGPMASACACACAMAPPRPPPPASNSSSADS